MRTTKLAAGLAALALCAMFFGGTAMAAEGKVGDQKGRRGKMKELLLNGKWVQHIEARIERIRARLAKHPNAPADVKAAAEKLIADLTNKKGDVEKLAAAVQAKDKAAAKAAWAQIKQDRQQTKGDRCALREAVKSHRHKGQRGGKGHEKA
jgi:DNA repair ATPase RecN